MDEDILRREGVEKLSRSPQGREYLQGLRKKYERDLIQPGDPRFQKVYGAQIKKAQTEKAKNEEKSKAMWEESQWRKEQKVPLSERKRFRL